MTPASRRTLLVVAVAVPLTAALAAVPIVLFGRKPPGAVVARTDARFGETFAVTWVSDGQPKRVFLDLDCENCMFPLRGTVNVGEVGGASVAQPLEIWTEQGEASSSLEIGNRYALVERKLFDLAPWPAGARVQLTGVLHNGTPAAVVSLGGPPGPRPVARTSVLRVYVAD